MRKSLSALLGLPSSITLEQNNSVKDSTVLKTKSSWAGEALAEVVNTLHNGRNTGQLPVKLVVFYTGAVGQALSVKPTPQP